MSADYWFEQRYDDAVWAAREALGLCGNCGESDAGIGLHSCGDA